MKKRIFSLILSLSLAACSCALFSSCAKPPEYAEIEERFIQLVEASYEVNKLVFGEGLDTYERVYDPKNSTEVYKDKDGKNVYYYEVYDPDSEDMIIAYRSSYLDDFSYVRAVKKPIEGQQAVFENADEKVYCYAIENYEEKKFDFYYSDSDPKYYDYVKADSPYMTVEQIKQKIETVYSLDYLNSSIYEGLFTGASASDDLTGLYARYIEYYDAETGSTALMESNIYEPLISETRYYDFSTARVVKPGSGKLVNIEVESYVNSKPDERITVRVTMVKQDGEWYLDSGTY